MKRGKLQYSGKDARGEHFQPKSEVFRVFQAALILIFAAAAAATLVAVHGGPSNSFESILPDLEPLAKNRRVIYYDQRGNGRSSFIKDQKKLDVAKHVADL